MRKLLILVVLALEVALCGCGNSTPATVPTTSASGNWEARLIGGLGDASLLDFVTTFSVASGGGTLNISSLAFFNNGACFSSGVTANGSAVLTTSSSDQVTGTMTLTIAGGSGNTLTLTANPPSGGVSGTSNGTSTSGGTLSNGVVWGTWTLSSSDPNCNATSGGTTFVMCQGNTTCTVP